MLRRRLWWSIESKLILLVIGAIILPALLLGYLALRATESDKLALEKRVEKNSRRQGRLLVQELDASLAEVEKRVAAVVVGGNLLTDRRPTVADVLSALERKDPLIAQLFLVSARDGVLYPEPAGNVSLSEGVSPQKGFTRHADRRETAQAYFLPKLKNKLALRVETLGPHMSSFERRTKILEGVPFLFSYVYILNQERDGAAGIFGIQANMQYFKEQLWAKRIQAFPGKDDLIISLLDEGNHLVLGGPVNLARQSIFEEELASTFDDWRLVIFPKTPHSLEEIANLRGKITLWMIGLLLLTLIAGAYVAVSSTNRAVKVARLKSDFVSNVSHELRTPLTSIRMFAELLLMGRVTSKEEQSHYLKIISRESERLSRLIDNVLDFAKIDKGLKRYQFEYEDVGQVVKGVVEAVRHHAQEQGFRIETHIQEKLPEAKIDADAISQILFNLLSNAMKYSEREKFIQVNVFQANSSLVTEVIDRGVGLARNEVPRIFEEFYRVDQRPSSERNGTGLGLTLAKRMAKAHGGDILVDTREGVGSRFSLVLPVAVPGQQV